LKFDLFERNDMPTHYRGTNKEVQALNAYINLFRAADSLAARAGTRLEAAGLTNGQFGVLEALLHLGPLCQRELGEKLLRTGGNITLVVDNLEREGLVRRERSRRDRRLVNVQLTPKGEKLIRAVFPGHAKAIAGEMRYLTSAEQKQLRRLCRKLGQGVANQSGNGGKHDSHSARR
jgi:MarR family transcriptional regulator, 2-MHQ and catechol-resistance regulon repressor